MILFFAPKASRLLLVGLAVTALSVPMGSASAAQQTVVEKSGPGFVEYQYADGATAGWYSEEYLRANPEQARARGITAHEDDAAFRTQSGSEWDGQTYISVTGKSLTVTDWTTQTLGNRGCLHASFLRNWKNFRPGIKVCPKGNGPGVYTANLHGKRKFKHKDALCNEWTKTTGQACITIKK